MTERITPRAAAPRTWRRVTSSPVVLALLFVVGALVAVAAWATASPPGSSPDEDFHLGSIWCPLGVADACPRQQGDDGTALVEIPKDVAGAAACTAFRPDASGACVDRLGTYPTWTGRVDDGTYPGGFYRFMHGFVGDDLTASVMTMRLVGGTVVVALLGAAMALLSATNRRLVVYGGLVVAAPMAIYLVASINPSGWSIAGVAAAWIGLHGYFTEASRGRRYGLLGVALAGAALAAISRADAGAFVALVSLAVAILHAGRIRRNWRHVVWPVAAAVIGVLGFFAGGQGMAVKTGLNGGGEAGRGLLTVNVKAVPALLLDSVVGSLNWLDTEMPAITWVPVALAAGAVAFLGLQTMSWSKALSLGGLALAFWLLPLLLLQLTGALVGTEVQGRYLTPLVPVILMTALWDPGRRTVARMSTAQTTVVAWALVVAHSAALHTQIRRFTTGLDVGGSNLNRSVEWWVSPVSPMATWALGTLGFAVLVAGLYVVGRRHRGAHDGAADRL